MTETSALQDRLAFLGIDAETRRHLKDFLPSLRGALPGILERFYRHLGGWPDMQAMFRDPSRITHARNAQERHWLTLFSGDFDDAYLASAHRIGLTHSRIGLEPRWYMGGYAASMNEIYALAVQTVATQRWRPANTAKIAHLLRALNKAAMLDMDLVISTYLDENKVRFDERLSQLANRFETSVKGIAACVETAAVNMKDNAVGVADLAQRAADGVNTIVDRTGRASHNIQTVASATEELSASIGEITQRVTDSNRIAQSAAQEAEATDHVVKNLAEAAQRIGDVVALINDIAAQTNLLALNATIEAARAGEAGKGFAVVAGEVKSLATQTAKATDDIRAQIANIQATTTQAVNAIANISGTIGQVGEITDAIAAAVTQQDAATREIARSVQQASADMDAINTSIGGVQSAAGQTGDVAQSVSSGASGLAGQVVALNGEVTRFLDDIRAA